MGRLVTISRGPRDKSTGIKVTGARGHWGKTLGAVLKSAKKVVKSAKKSGKKCYIRFRHTIWSSLR